jgi:hypothetical protein
MKIKLRDQIVVANAVVLAGLVFEYFRGSSLRSIVVTGVLLLAMVNLTFFIRAQEKKSGL